MSINSSLVKLADKIDVDGKSTVSPEYKNPNNSIEKSLERIADNYEGGGGSSELPEVTAEDNGDVLTVVNGKWDKASGGGTGGGVTIATYSSEDGHTFTCDMTLAQIFGVFNSGGFVVAHNEWTGNYEYPTYVSEADENVTYYLVTMDSKSSTSVSVSFESISHTGDGIYGNGGYGSITGYTPD